MEAVTVNHVSRRQIGNTAKYVSGAYGLGPLVYCDLVVRILDDECRCLPVAPCDQPIRRPIASYINTFAEPTNGRERRGNFNVAMLSANKFVTELIFILLFYFQKSPHQFAPKREQHFLYVTGNVYLQYSFQLLPLQSYFLLQFTILILPSDITLCYQSNLECRCV